MLPRTGCAIDLAGGAGRHSIWLTQRGLQVTLTDVSDVALSMAEQRAREINCGLTTVNVDLTDLDAVPRGPWDLVLVVHYWQPSLIGWAKQQLSDAGVLVYIQPTVTNLERHSRPSLRFLAEPGEIGRLAAGMQILEYSEAWRRGGQHEARLVARRSSRAVQ